MISYSIGGGTSCVNEVIFRVRRLGSELPNSGLIMLASNSRISAVTCLCCMCGSKNWGSEINDKCTPKAPPAFALRVLLGTPKGGHYRKP